MARPISGGGTPRSPLPREAQGRPILAAPKPEAKFSHRYPDSCFSRPLRGPFAPLDPGGRSALKLLHQDTVQHLGDRHEALRRCHHHPVHGPAVSVEGLLAAGGGIAAARCGFSGKSCSAVCPVPLATTRHPDNHHRSPRLAAVAGPGNRMQPGRARHRRSHHRPHRPLRSMRKVLPLP